jgi:hypothetical protein
VGSSATATSKGSRAAASRELIARQIRVFAARGERFEWKVHSHDRPPDYASSDSRPILQRLGFTAVTATTPYVWSSAATA